MFHDSINVTFTPGYRGHRSRFRSPCVAFGATDRCAIKPQTAQFLALSLQRLPSMPELLEVPTLDTEFLARTTAPTLTLHLIVEAKHETIVIPLPDGASVIVGRGGRSSFVLECGEVSREHARFTRHGDRVEVEDERSRNGTWLDGRRVTGKAPLSRSSIVILGSVRIGLALLEEKPAPSPQEATPLTDDGQVVIADEVMQRLFEDATRLAPTSCSILITGETGVGKESLASHIHRSSKRALAPFIRLNCASLAESLLESELFGFERGAFTGADKRREGWLEAASGGTIFLDEIGEMPISMQVKLLRAVESGRLTRLGSTLETPIDVRIVSATHRDLVADVANGRFRADLYYRLASVTISIPPLRDRPTEIRILAKKFAESFAKNNGLPLVTIDGPAMGRLMCHTWPGNIRELRNVIERAVILGDQRTITLSTLPNIGTAPANNRNEMRVCAAEAERGAIESALRFERGNQTKAARRLGVSRRTLVYKIVKYGLRP